MNSKTPRLHIFDKQVTESEFGMPVIPKYKGTIPEILLPFNKAVAQKRYNCTPHFYLNDKEFIRVLRCPEKYLEMLKNMGEVLWEY